MGSVVSSAANGVGTLVGNVVSAPFMLLFAPPTSKCISSSFLTAFDFFNAINIQEWWITLLALLFLVLISGVSEFRTPLIYDCWFLLSFSPVCRIRSVCSGTWDLPCFIEHVCISSLLRLFVVIIVTYIGVSMIFHPARSTSRIEFVHLLN